MESEGEAGSSWAGPGRTRPASCGVSIAGLSRNLQDGDAACGNIGKCDVVPSWDGHLDGMYEVDSAITETSLPTG
jgi:hypothetical protein